MKAELTGQISMFEILGAYEFANEREELLAEALKTGSGFAHGKTRLAEAVRLGVHDLAGSMRKEYGTGGHSMNKICGFVDYDSRGMKITIWGKGKQQHRVEAYTWKQAANMLTQLVVSGRYFNKDGGGRE